MASGIWKQKGDQEHLRFWRWVTSTCCLSKLFERCAVCVAQQEVGEAPCWLTAFRKGYQAADVTGVLCMILRRAHEWQQPVLVASVDVLGIRPHVCAKDGKLSSRARSEQQDDRSTRA